MWTYLLIFFSLTVLVGVFVRRWILLSKESSCPCCDPLDNKSPEEEEVNLSRKDRSLAESLYEKGGRLLSVGKEEDAIKCFVQVLSLDPAHKETLHRLGVLYLQKQMFGPATALFQQLSEISPDPLHFSHLGLALFNQSDFENAKIAYQKALELDSSRPQRFVSLSQVYRALDMPLHSIIALNKAIELEDENIETLFLLADAKMEIKKLQCAKAILTKVLEIDPSNKNAKSLLREIRDTEQSI